MAQPENVSILGAGHSLGDVVRGNDDPVFDYLRAHPPPNSDLFAGLKFRRALGPDESVATIMVTAAQNALVSAHLLPGDIDMLLGSGSVGEFYAPNALSAVHNALGLSTSCRALALNTEYTTFLDAMKIAHDLIACGTIQTALVVCGMDWTQHVNYTEAVSAAASDAAGAAVVGRSSDAAKFHLVDWENETDSSWYGAFKMARRPIAATQTAAQGDDFTRNLMKVDDTKGRAAIMNFGIPAPPRIVARLLERNGLASSEITLVAHQTSPVIADKWRTAIAAALYVSTLEDLADMVSASVPVNLSITFDRIPTDHLVLVGIGMEMHCTALLYSRNSQQRPYVTDVYA